MWDSIFTVAHNTLSQGKTSQIAEDGSYTFQNNSIDQITSFGNFAEVMWSHYQTSPKKLDGEKAFEIIQEMKNFSELNDIELIFIITPHHVYFEQFMEISGRTHVFEAWMRELIQIAGPIYTFALSNSMTYEAVSRDMKYWYDPLHFSKRMGKIMLEELQKVRNSGEANSAIIQEVTNETIPEIIANRKQAVAEWTRQNPDYIKQMLKHKK